MDIKGCGKSSETLTFHVLPKEPMSKHHVIDLACGQRAESSGGRGVLLCHQCAGLYGFKVFKREETSTGGMDL